MRWLNAMSLLTRATLAELGEFAEMRLAIRSLLGEVAAVAAALEVALPVMIDRRLAAGFAVGSHKSSMLQDFEAASLWRSTA